MRTEELAALLSQAPPARPPLRLTSALALLTAAVMAATFLTLGLRPDIATPPLSMAQKSLLLLSLLAAAGLELSRAARPVASRTGGGWIAPAAAAGLFTGALIWEWQTVPASAIFHSFTLRNFPFCLGAVSVYGALGAAALTALLRHYAPGEGGRAAAAIGLAAAAAGAVGYSIHCPIDSPTFVLIAYGLPLSWMTLAGRFLLPRLIRW